MDIEHREYQQRSIEKTLEYFNNGCKSVLLEAPTGSGKTVMGLKIVQGLMQTAGKKLSCAWVAPRHYLLNQLLESNSSFDLPITPVSMFTAPEKAEQFDIVVIDEAHHEATSSFINLYTRMNPKYLLGLSATPLRTDKVKLVFSATVSECNIHQLIRDGYLCKFNSYIIDNFTPEAVAEQYLKNEKLWGKTLVFMPTLEECAKFQTLIRQAGKECLFIRSGDDRARELFEQGTAPLAVNCQLLTEGFDMPQLQTVFVRKSSRLPMIQMAGRVLRNHPGKQIANIVQPKNTPFPAKKMADPEQILHWRRDRFVALNGQNNILTSTLRKTLELRDKLKKSEPKIVCEFGETYYVSV